MASAHVSALQNKHAGLEAAIAAEQARPAPDDAMLSTLKRQKLKIKEQIAAQ